ncbi:MAG: amino acid kinase family protein, partial [Candidatus Ranarchaeia archaeon]
TSPGGIRSRYTDKETIDLFVMAVAGEANKLIVRQFLSQGIPAVGISGLDANTINAKRKKKLKIRKDEKILLIDGGYTGKIQMVNPHLLTTLLGNGFVPVVAALASSENFEPLNIDGDEAARFIAQSLSADHFVILTDVPGVLSDKKRLIPHINKAQLPSELGRVTVGMKRKLLAINAALENGIRRVSIASGLVDTPLSNALKGHNCTVIE